MKRHFVCLTTGLRTAVVSKRSDQNSTKLLVATVVVPERPRKARAFLPAAPRAGEDLGAAALRKSAGVRGSPRQYGRKHSSVVSPVISSDGAGAPVCRLRR